MAVRDFFRNGDKVSVHGLLRAQGRILPGRVICDNKKSKYGLCLIALIDLGDEEISESFTINGKRYRDSDKVRLTLGHPPKE